MQKAKEAKDDLKKAIQHSERKKIEEYKARAKKNTVGSPGDFLVKHGLTQVEVKNYSLFA